MYLEGPGKMFAVVANCNVIPLSRNLSGGTEINTIDLNRPKFDPEPPPAPRNIVTSTKAGNVTLTTLKNVYRVKISVEATLWNADLNGINLQRKKLQQVIDAAETSSAPHNATPFLSRDVKWSFPHEIPKMENKAESLMYAVDNVGCQTKPVKGF
jgi:hypothetical protein